MKNLSKLFLTITIFILTLLITTSCKSVPLSETPEFSSESNSVLLTPAPEFSGFVGTWERVSGKSRHTLTITLTTIKASNQNYNWNISSVSGDIYTIFPTPDPNLKGTISIKRVGDYLEVIDAYDMSNSGVWGGGEDDWTGRWRMR